MRPRTLLSLKLPEDWDSHYHHCVCDVTMTLPPVTQPQDQSSVRQQIDLQTSAELCNLKDHP